MDEVDVSKLSNVGLVGNYDGLDARLKQIEFSWDTCGIKAEGTFCYVAFRDSNPTQDEFVQIIYDKITDFCLQRDFINDRVAKFKVTNNKKYIIELSDAARDLFIKAKKKNTRSGEPGELVLFVLLEGLLQAPRIVAKMYLKTNANMEVYGSDAIHMRYQNDTKSLNLYWGEAKLYKELAGALDKIVESVHKFNTPDSETGLIPRDFDINIIKKHADIVDEDAMEALMSFLDPYTQHYANLHEINACLAIWDWEFYKTLPSDPSDIEENFKTGYVDRIKSACELFTDKIKAKGIEHLRFHFFLLPLVDKQQFRKLFCCKVGLPYFEDADADD
ncbi:MAG: DUF1837 domain-containing protein [Dehalococcoidia bacterium]|nr:DUF1837 domain-containing protein [Dehalococcoidia bacterium]